MIEPVQIDDRIAKCEKILSVNPNSQIFAALAEALRKKGELDKAFRICQSGLKIHAAYGSAHIVMAKINLDRGLYDWAEAEARKAAGIDGRTRSVELLLAEIYIYKGEFAKATKNLKKLSLQDPGNGQIKKLLDIAERLPREQATMMEGTQAPAAIPAPVVPEVGEVAPGKPKSLDMRQILQQGIKIAGIDGVMFINFEGLVVDLEWTLQADQDAYGATMGEIGNQINQELIKTSFGSFGAAMIESKAGICYLLRVVDGYYLFVTQPTVSLGTLRIKIENLLNARR